LHNDLKVIAITIILDYFNGIYTNKPFNKITKTEIINKNITSDNDIYLYLLTRMENNLKSLRDKNIVMENLKFRGFEKLNPDDDENHCCDFHYNHRFNPSKCNDVIDLYNRKIDKLQKIDYGVIILGEKLFINVDDISVLEDKVIFKNTGFSSRINFAACWNSGNRPKDYIDNIENDVKIFHIPHIIYIKEPLGYHLSIDMFHCDFIIKQEKKMVIPKIREHPKDVCDEEESDEEESDEEEFDEEESEEKESEEEKLINKI
jgi:hypothetical protein